MKKLIYACLAVLFFTTLVNAQKVAQKDLQGTWKMISFTAGGLNVDIPTEKITLSPEMEAQMTPEVKQQMQDGMKQAMEIFKSSFAYVEGNSLRQTMGGQEQKGSFTMKEQDGKQYLVLTTEGGTTEDILVTITDKKLHLSQGQGNDAAKFIYAKQ